MVGGIPERTVTKHTSIIVIGDINPPTPGRPRQPRLLDRSGETVTVAAQVK